MNPYIEIKNSFQFLDCAVRQREVLSRCRSLPGFVDGRDPEAALRDYLFGLMLVSAVAQFEWDLNRIPGVPGLRGAGGLSTRLRLLRDHFQISVELFDAVSRIRDARNRFVHNRTIGVDAGCTKAQVPEHLVTFLHRCNHPEYS